MRNKLVLIGYLAFFFALVSAYHVYKDNVYLVALVAGILTFAGLAVWLWSAQTGKREELTARELDRCIVRAVGRRNQMNLDGCNCGDSCACKKQPLV